MSTLIQHYLKMSILKSAPQDLPASSVLQLILITLYFILALINTSSINNLSNSMIHSIVDLAMLFLFAHVLLRDKKQRINQTLNAFIGVGLIIGVIHTVSSVLLPSSQDPQDLSAITQLIFFIIFIWVVVVYGHIIRHATETNMVVACSISLIYIVLNVMVLVSIAEFLKAS